MTISAPHWDLTNVYPSLESKEFKSAVKKYKKLLNELEIFLEKKVSKTDKKTPAKKLGAVLGESVDRFNAIAELSGTLGSYIYSFVTTDSRNTLAMRTLSQFEQIGVHQAKLNTEFR